MGMPDLPKDERFKDIFTRNSHEPELTKIIEGWTTQFTTEEVVKKLIAAGAPVAAVHDIKQAIDHPHTRARGMLNEVEQPGTGTLVLMGPPVKATNYQVGKPGHTHAIGEDNMWLLTEILGKNEAEIKKITESKVMG
jgi:crotonobetainyl-CoA:carnitine CoA-transferase CaiB-like acyl-CoA transferase